MSRIKFTKKYNVLLRTYLCIRTFSTQVEVKSHISPTMQNRRKRNGKKK